MTWTSFGNGLYTYNSNTDTQITTGITTGSGLLDLFTNNKYLFTGGAWVLIAGGGGGATNLDGLTDVDTTTVAPTNNQVLTYNTAGTKWVPATPPGAGGGEANTTSNVGTGEGILALAKSGVNLPLKSLKQGTNITLTNNANDVTITATGGGAGTVTPSSVDIFTNKTMDAKDNIFVNVIPETFNIWKVSTTYYCKANRSGAITSNASFVTLITNAINSVTAGNPIRIVITEGDFDIATILQIPKSRIGNISIIGAGSGLTNFIITSAWNGTTLGNQAIFIGEPPTIAAGITGTLTANCTKRALSCTMSTGDSAKFAVGDYILVKSNAIFSADPVSVAKQGEIKRVSAVNTGTGVVTFDVPAFDTYNTANTAVVYKLSNFISNITLQGITIKRGTGLNFTDGVLFCEFSYIDNLQLRDIELIDNVTQYDSGINVKSCINSNIDGLMLRQTTAATYNLQYGLALGTCSQNITVSNVRAFGRFRHAVECSNGSSVANYSGMCRGITFTNVVVEGSEVGGIDNHGDGENLSYTNCTVLGTTQSSGNVGFEIRSRKTQLVNCVAKGAQNYGFQFSGDAHDCCMVGCTADGNITDGARLVNDLLGVKRFTAMGCHFINNGNNGFRTDADCNQLTLIGNTSMGNSNTGMYIRNCSDVFISNNFVNSNTAEGIWLDATVAQTDVMVTNNNLESNAGAGNLVINASYTSTIYYNNTGVTAAGVDSFTTTLSNKTISSLKTGYLSVTTTPVTLSAITDQMVKVDANGGARTVNLPTVSGNSGLFYTIIKSDSSANNVTIDGASSETINGATTYLLTAQYQSVVLRCDGAAWFTQVNTSERTGTATGTANGSNVVFNINHGLGGTPYRAFVQCSSHSNTFTYTTSTTQIVVTFGTAPSSSPATAIFHWSAVL